MGKKLRVEDGGSREGHYLFHYNRTLCSVVIQYKDFPLLLLILGVIMNLWTLGPRSCDCDLSLFTKVENTLPIISSKIIKTCHSFQASILKLSVLDVSCLIMIERLMLVV